MCLAWDQDGSKDSSWMPSDKKIWMLLPVKSRYRDQENCSHSLITTGNFFLCVILRVVPRVLVLVKKNWVLVKNSWFLCIQRISWSFSSSKIIRLVVIYASNNIEQNEYYRDLEKNSQYISYLLGDNTISEARVECVGSGLIGIYTIAFWMS